MWRNYRHKNKSRRHNSKKSQFVSVNEYYNKDEGRRPRSAHPAESSFKKHRYEKWSPRRGDRKSFPSSHGRSATSRYVKEPSPDPYPPTSGPSAPDHCWVGEYLDEDRREHDLVPLNYDETVNQMPRTEFPMKGNEKNKERVVEDYLIVRDLPIKKFMKYPKTKTEFMRSSTAEREMARKRKARRSRVESREELYKSIEIEHEELVKQSVPPYTVCYDYGHQSKTKRKKKPPPQKSQVQEVAEDKAVAPDDLLDHYVNILKKRDQARRQRHDSASNLGPSTSNMYEVEHDLSPPEKKYSRYNTGRDSDTSSLPEQKFVPETSIERELLIRKMEKELQALKKGHIPDPVIVEHIEQSQVIPSRISTYTGIKQTISRQSVSPISPTSYPHHTAHEGHTTVNYIPIQTDAPVKIQSHASSVKSSRTSSISPHSIEEVQQLKIKPNFQKIHKSPPSKQAAFASSILRQEVVSPVSGNLFDQDQTLKRNFSDQRHVLLDEKRTNRYGAEAYKRQFEDSPRIVTREAPRVLEQDITPPPGFTLMAKMTTKYQSNSPVHLIQVTEDQYQDEEKLLTDERSKSPPEADASSTFPFFKHIEDEDESDQVRQSDESDDRGMPGRQIWKDKEIHGHQLVREVHAQSKTGIHPAKFQVQRSREKKYPEALLFNKKDQVLPRRVEKVFGETNEMYHHPAPSPILPPVKESKRQKRKRRRLNRNAFANKISKEKELGSSMETLQEKYGNLKTKGPYNTDVKNVSNVARKSEKIISGKQGKRENMPAQSPGRGYTPKDDRRSISMEISSSTESSEEESELIQQNKERNRDRNPLTKRGYPQDQFSSRDRDLTRNQDRSQGSGFVFDISLAEDRNLKQRADRTYWDETEAFIRKTSERQPRDLNCKTSYRDVDRRSAEHDGIQRKEKPCVNRDAIPENGRYGKSKSRSPRRHEMEQDSRKVIHDVQLSSPIICHDKPWVEDYKSWFNNTLRKTLQTFHAKNLNLDDPLVFLESATRGERTCLPYMPKGHQAKILLKFIDQKKQSSSDTSDDLTRMVFHVDNERASRRSHERQNSAKRQHQDFPTSSNRRDIPEEEQGFTPQLQDFKSPNLPATQPQQFYLAEEPVLNDNYKKCKTDEEQTRKNQYLVKKQTRRRQNSTEFRKYPPPSGTQRSKELLDAPESAGLHRESYIQHPPTSKKHTKEAVIKPLIPGLTEDVAREKKNTGLPEVSNRKRRIDGTEKKEFSRNSPRRLLPESHTVSERTEQKVSMTGLSKPPNIKSASSHVRNQEKDAYSSEQVEDRGKRDEKKKQLSKRVSSPIRQLYTSRPSSEQGMITRTEDRNEDPARRRDAASSVSTASIHPASLTVSSQENKDTNHHKQRRESAKFEEKVQRKEEEDLKAPSMSSQRPSIGSKEREKKSEPIRKNQKASTVQGNRDVNKGENTLAVSRRQSTDASDTQRKDKIDEKAENQKQEKRSAQESKTPSNSNRALLGEVSKRPAVQAAKHGKETKPKETFSPSLPRQLHSVSNVQKSTREKNAQTRIGVPKSPSIFKSQKKELFKQEVASAIVRRLNVLFKFEDYAKENLISVAKDIVFKFQKESKVSFTVDEAIHEIWMFFQDPTAMMLDVVKRRLKKVNLDKPNFNVNIEAFFRFKNAVFQYCDENLRPLAYTSQKQSHKRYVRRACECIFPQFYGEGTAMIELWSWLKRITDVTQNGVQWRTDIPTRFPGHERKSYEECMEHYVKHEIKDPLYDYLDTASCDIIGDVMWLQHKKRVACTTKGALKDIVNAWIKGHFNSIKDALALDEHHEVSAEETSGMEDLIILDEVYSDDAEDDSRLEFEVDVSDEISSVSSVQVIDLF